MKNAAPVQETSPHMPAAPVSIPRITIHAFCEDQATASVIQSAAVDRRMAKARTEVHLGGIAGAIQLYSQQPTPDVLLVECRKDRDQVMMELAGLAQVCEPTTKVIVIGHINDVILYRELMRAGISEYMVTPFSEVQFIETIGDLFEDPDSEPVGRLMAFIGAKGGVGSSSIAQNIGYYISKTFGSETVIADLDLSFGTVGLNFAVDSAQGIADALGSPDRVDEVLMERLLAKCTDNLRLLLAPGSVDKEAEVDKDALERVLDVARKSAPVVVADVPNTWTPWSKNTLAGADDVVVVATPDLACVRNTKNLITQLKTLRKNDNDPILVLNQVGMPKRPEVPAAEFAKAVGIEPTIILQHDAQNFGNAANNAQSLFEVAAKSANAQQLATLAEKLTGREPKAKASGGKIALPSFLNKLTSMGKK